MLIGGGSTRRSQHHRPPKAGQAPELSGPERTPAKSFAQLTLSGDHLAVEYVDPTGSNDLLAHSLRKPYLLFASPLPNTV
jgi:hypothetical protein